MVTLSLSLLGSYEAELNGRSLLPLRSNKDGALLAYLLTEQALAAGMVHRREKLMELLWPGMPETSARQNLRQVLYQLRQAIPAVAGKAGTETVALLLADRQSVQLNPDAVYDLDVASFLSLLVGEPTQAQLEQAVALYRGDFLVDFHLPDSSDFEAWAAARREELRRRALETLGKLTTLYLQQDAYGQAEATARRQLSIDNLRESAHRQLMEALARRGRRLEALAYYQKLQALLADELGVAPSAETDALLAAIEEDHVGAPLAAPPVVVSPPAPPSPSPPPHNLPPQSSPFIGREAELTKLDELLADTTTRLITIVGLGGMGKTRVAVAAAERQIEHSFLSHGVFFISLAQLSSAEQIAPAIAGALGLSPTGEGSIQQQVIDYVREKQLLLLLDNFEHLLEGVVLLTAILQTAPAVKLLVTSRERLNLPEEQRFPLQGLPFPEPNSSQPIDDYPAVQLFLQRARRIQPILDPADDELQPVAHICRMAEGMPLAIELAAAWMDVLSPAEIAQEIAQGLDFLATEMRQVPERQRSVRATFDHTWRRLSQSEQAVFARLSIFRGGFTRRAAEEVAEATLPLLSRLVSKSLLQYRRERDGYEVHELLRQYGADRLTQERAGEAGARNRHSAFYCAWLGEQVARLRGAEQREVLAEMEVENENIRIAWRWAVEHGQIERLTMAVDGLGFFSELRGRYEEDRVLIRLASNRLQTMGSESGAPAQRTLVLAKLLAWQGVLSWATPGIWSPEHHQARDFLEESLSLLESLKTSIDVRTERAFSLHQLGRLVVETNPVEINEARQWLEESLALYRSLGDISGTADVLYQLAWVAITNHEYAKAERYISESLTLSEAMGDQRRVIHLVTALGGVYRQAAQYDKAREQYERAMAAAREQGDLWIIFDPAHHVIGLEFCLGRFESAAQIAAEILTLARQIKSRFHIAQALHELGKAYFFQGRTDHGMVLLEQAATVAAELGLTAGMYPHVIEERIYIGQYEAAAAQIHLLQMRTLHPIELGWALRGLGWINLAHGAYDQAQEHLAESVRIFAEFGKPDADREWAAWSQAPLGMALHRLGEREQSHRCLFDALKITVEIRGFIPLMHLMPVIPAVLADEDDPALKKRAVELYASAESHPFVANSQLFRDVAGRYVEEATAALPADVVEAARERGRGQAWWEVAEGLLEELGALGWSANKAGGKGD